MAKKRKAAKRAAPPRVDSGADVRDDLTRALRRRFPGVAPALLKEYRSVLFPLLLLGDDEKKGPDDSKPGEMGKRADPNEILVWRHPKGKKGDWEVIYAKEFEPCDNIIIEVAFRELDTECPPPDGFAAMVKAAVREAREIAESPPCPDECAGTYVDVSYKKWYCEEDDAVVIVQVCRMCNVL